MTGGTGTKSGEFADVERRAGRDRLAALIGGVAAGDHLAFQHLYEATGARLFGVALGLMKRRDLAEEVVQEAYISVWRRAASYRADRGTPMTWLIAILRYRAIDRLRQLRADRTLSGLPFEAPDEGPGPFDWAAASEDGRRLQRCLETLDPRQRECILMSVIEGLTHEELSARIDSPLGTVKSWIRRGLKRLKECLG